MFKTIRFDNKRFSASQRQPPYSDPFVISHARYHKIPRIYPLVATPPIPFTPYRRYSYDEEIPEPNRRHQSGDWTSSPHCQLTGDYDMKHKPRSRGSDLNTLTSTHRKHGISAENDTVFDPLSADDQINESFEVCLPKAKGVDIKFYGKVLMSFSNIRCRIVFDQNHWQC
uniref:Velvet domain-containing protein n=1 Tax=Angiostrongylus cantonensis TaxID=6313 RepID=A0A0K0DBK5_ANGCA